MAIRRHRIPRGWHARTDGEDPARVRTARRQRRSRGAVPNDGRPLALAAVVLGLALLFLNARGGVDLEALIGTLLP